MNLPPQPEFSPEGNFLNWIEIETWGRLNSPTWNDVTKTCQKAKLGELHRLRILCSVLLYESERYKDITVRAAMERPNIIKL